MSNIETITINAQIATLKKQRENACDDVVNLVAKLEVANVKIESLENENKGLRAEVERLTKSNSESGVSTEGK
jgi:uncharacterized coiled-coil DUF342 family protein